jgi:hypothetical protein
MSVPSRSLSFSLYHCTGRRIAGQYLSAAIIIDTWKLNGGLRMTSLEDLFRRTTEERFKKKK